MIGDLCQHSWHSVLHIVIMIYNVYSICLEEITSVH